MSDPNNPIRRVTHLLSRLPGIGEKTASRLTFHLLKSSEAYVRELSEALIDLKLRIRHCSVCANHTEMDPCELCVDSRRSDEMVCVVEHPQDVMAIERGREYRGRYHVLHGALSPLDGVGPDQLKIPLLLARLSEGAIKEVIMATDPDVEGEATALYLSRLIRPMGLRVTRLAHGIPVGSELEYVDHVTIQKALDNRRDL